MRFLPKKRRCNILLLGSLFLFVFICTVALSSQKGDDDDYDSLFEDFHEQRALSLGQKMKILPAGPAINSRPQGEHIEIGGDEGGELEQFDGQLQEVRRRSRMRWELGRRPEGPGEVQFDNGGKNPDDEYDNNDDEQRDKEDDEEEEEEEEEDEEGDEPLVGKAEGRGQVKGQEQDPHQQQGDRKLPFDPRQVQDCITRDVIGSVPLHMRTQDIQLTPIDVASQSEDPAARKRDFKRVFDDRAWGRGWDKAYDRLEASGRGATLSWSQEVTATLHLLLNDMKAALGKRRLRVLDLPCGDMAWMSRFLQTRPDVDYTGIDIVPDLIDNHRKAYRGESWRFLLVDVLQQPLTERFDVILCRMLLQHLYLSDARELLRRLSATNSTFLVTTTFSRLDVNKELDFKDNPGRIRKLNLELPPFSLVPPLCLSRDGPPNTFEGWDHFIGVWQLPLKRLPECISSQKMTLKGTEHEIHSCTNWKLR